MPARRGRQRPCANWLKLWAAGTPTSHIAASLGRGESEVGAKAVELKLPRKH
jgi:hypothetical protein